MSLVPEQLIGSWRLLQWELEYQEDGRRRPFYDEKPDGWFVFTNDGRASAIIVGPGRRFGTSEAEQAELLRTLFAYTGRYRLEGDRLIIDVDVSWNQLYTGTAQERFVQIEGKVMRIVSAWAPYPVLPGSPTVRGWLIWEKA